MSDTPVLSRGSDGRCSLVAAAMDEPTEEEAKSRLTYKTELCARWISGACAFGHDCCFAHGADELRERVRPERCAAAKRRAKEAHRTTRRMGSSRVFTPSY